MNSSSRSWAPHFKEVTWVAIGQIAAAAGGLLAIKASTNVLDPAEFGRFSAALSIVGLGQVCLFAPISQAATRFFSIATEQRIYGTYQSSLIKLYLLSAGIIVFSFFGLTYIGLSQMLALPLVLIALYMLVAGIQSIQLSLFNAERLRKWVAGLQIIDALLRPALVGAVLLLATRTSSEVMGAYILTSLVVAMAAMAASKSRRSSNQHLRETSLQGAKHEDLFRRMASFAWPFVAFGILGAVGSHGERLLLINFVSWQDIGIYSLMSQLALAPNLMLTSIINQYYLPKAYQADPHGSSTLGRGYRYYLVLSLLGIAAVTVAVASLGRWIVPLLSNAAFQGHEHLLWVLALAAGIFNLGQQLVLPGMRRYRLNVYLPSKLLHSIALLCVALLLTPTLGVDGMALAALSAAVVYSLSVACANAYLARSA